MNYLTFLYPGFFIYNNRTYSTYLTRLWWEQKTIKLGVTVAGQIDDKT